MLSRKNQLCCIARPNLEPTLSVLQRRPQHNIAHLYHSGVQNFPYKGPFDLLIFNVAAADDAYVFVGLAHRFSFVKNVFDFIEIGRAIRIQHQYVLSTRVQIPSSHSSSFALIHNLAEAPNETSCAIVRFRVLLCHLLNVFESAIFTPIIN